MTQIQAKKPATPMSPQTRQAIGITALVLCLLVGGGIVWWFLFGSSPRQREVTIDSNQPIRLRGRQLAVPRVTRAGANAWDVRGDSGTMRATQAGNDYKLTFTYNRGQLGLPQEHVTLVSAQFRILNDPAMAKAWGVTAEQREKLKKIEEAGAALRPSDDDRATLRQLFDQYQDASDKEAPQQKLVDKLDQVARANLEVSKKAMQDRVAQIQQILTPEQIKKIMK